MTMIRSNASAEPLRVCAGLAIAFMLLTLARPAAAEPAPTNARTTEPAPPKLERRWYGWQTLATDGGAIALLTGTALLNQGEPAGPLATTGFVLGTLSYALGGPIVHFAHHNPGRGFASFGLRVPVPIVAGLATAAAFCGTEPGEYCGLIGLPVGAAGILTAIIIDATVFSYDEVPVESAGSRTFHLLPVVSLTRHGGSLGLALSL